MTMGLRQTFFAAAALLAGAASALSTDWTDWAAIPTMADHSGDSRYNNKSVPVIAEIVSDFAVSGSFTTGTIKSSTGNWGVAMGLTPGSGDRGQIILRGGSGGVGSFLFLMGSAGSGALLAGGIGSVEAHANTTYTFLFEYDYETDSLSAYVNDVLLGTFADVGYDKGVSLEEVSLGLQSGGAVFLNSVCSDVVYLKDERFSVTRVLPEPTALALLALGAAGLALRRRP